MLQNLISTLHNTFAELRANKLRTLLSLLGIAIGIFCIVMVSTVIDSLKRQINNSLSSLGSNVLYVNKYAWIPEPGEKSYPWWRYKARPLSTLQELKHVRKTVPGIGYAALMYQTNTTAQSLTTKSNVEVIAGTYDILTLQNLNIYLGRYFTRAEMDASSSNIIVGVDIAQDFFGTTNVVGKSLKVYDKPCTIIGVLKKQGKSITNRTVDNQIIMTYTFVNSVQKIDDPSNEWADNSLMIGVKPNANFKEVCEEVRGSLRAYRKVKPSEKDNFSFNLLSVVQSAVDSIFRTVNAAGLFIGIFSLLVGAFGIANIMFVTVKERTPQIGLKKAVGAKKSIILSEFLIESIILSLLGGSLGILLVFFATLGIKAASELPISMALGNVLFGVIMSTIVGIIAGYIPARRASNLDPVTAIRS